MYDRLMILQHQKLILVFFFSISKYSAKFDCSPNFSGMLYCNSDSQALYEVIGILISVTVPSEWSKTNIVYSILK